MSTNLEYTAEKDRKRESGRYAGEAQREKGRQGFRARDKKQRRYVCVGRTTWKFCSGGDKMRNASGDQCKVKTSSSEKMWTGIRTTFPPVKKRITKKFLEVSTLLAEAFPLCFSALYCHSLRGFGCSRFVLVVSVPRKRPLQTAVWDSCRACVLDTSKI